MPHTDPSAACSQITHYLKDIPAWPQLPKRSFLENMYVQYSEGFPGVVVENDRIYVDRSQDSSGSLERLYTAYLENDFDDYPVGRDYAAGLDAFLGLDDLSPRAVKGQVTGPISWGLTVTDKDKRSIIYDDVLGDAAAKLLTHRPAPSARTGSGHRGVPGCGRWPGAARDCAWREACCYAAPAHGQEQPLISSRRNEGQRSRP